MIRSYMKQPFILLLMGKIHSVVNTYAWMALLLLVVQALFSCSENRERGNYQISKIDTLEIKVPGYFNNRYPKQAEYEHKGEHFLLTYDNFSHSIEKINLSKKRHEKSIQLAKEGPNGIISVLSIEKYLDSLILIDNSIELTIINEDGEVIKKWKKVSGNNYSLTGSDLSNFSASARGAGILIKGQDKVINNRYPRNIFPDKGEYYENETLFEIEINNGTVRPLPYFYPTYVNQTGVTYGQNLQKFILALDSVLILSYPFEPNLHLFYPSTNVTTTIHIQNKHLPSAKPMPNAVYSNVFERIKWFENQPQYARLYYHSTLDLFFRPFRFPGKTEVSEYEQGFVLLNNHFNVMGIVPIGNDISTVCLLTESGICFRYKDPDSESRLRFICYNFAPEPRDK
jgi:hypothetical protein